MGVREIGRSLERWQMGAKDLRRRMILAPTPRERERWHTVWLVAQGWTAEELERNPHTSGNRGDNPREPRWGAVGTQPRYLRGRTPGIVLGAAGAGADRRADRGDPGQHPQPQLAAARPRAHHPRTGPGTEPWENFEMDRYDW